MIKITENLIGRYYYATNNHWEFIGKITCLRKLAHHSYFSVGYEIVWQNPNMVFYSRGGEKHLRSSNFAIGSEHHNSIKKIFNTKEEVFSYII